MLFFGCSAELQGVFACLQGICQASGSNCGCLVRQRFTVSLSMTGRYVQRHSTLCLLLAGHILHIAAVVDQ